MFINMADRVTQTFRGIASARDCDHHGHLMMSGWSAAVSDALRSALANAGIDSSTSDADSTLVEVDQRITMLAPVTVGASIELTSGVVAVYPDGLTVGHLGVVLSQGRTSVVHSWSIASPTNVDGIRRQLSSEQIRRFELLCVSEREIFR